MFNTLLSYDLHYADQEMYAQARSILESFGLQHGMPADGVPGAVVRMPESTAIGNFNVPGLNILDTIWNAFATANLRPKRIAVLQSGGIVIARMLE